MISGDHSRKTDQDHVYACRPSFQLAVILLSFALKQSYEENQAKKHGLEW
jgi:hypothetical protein